MALIRIMTPSEVFFSHCHASRNLSDSSGEPNCNETEQIGQTVATAGSKPVVQIIGQSRAPSYHPFMEWAADEDQ